MIFKNSLRRKCEYYFTEDNKKQLHATDNQVFTERIVCFCTPANTCTNGNDRKLKM